MSSRKRGTTAGLINMNKRTRIGQPLAAGKDTTLSYTVAPSAPSSTEPALHLPSQQPPTPEYTENQPCDLIPAIGTQERKFSECIEEAISCQAKFSELWREGAQRQEARYQQLLSRIQQLEDSNRQQNFMIYSQGEKIEGLQAMGKKQEQILAALKKDLADLNGKHDGMSEFLHVVMDRLKTVSISDLFKGFLSR
ncbi:hypothetical protein BDW67DRAFT_160042 [Aspergillus spinulosporus]